MNRYIIISNGLISIERIDDALLLNYEETQDVQRLLGWPDANIRRWKLMDLANPMPDFLWIGES